MRNSGTQQQPPSIPNNRPAIWDLVLQDIRDRDQVGEHRYGTRLQGFNGRDALTDFYQELLDAVVYIRQILYERDVYQASFTAVAEAIIGNLREIEHHSGRVDTDVLKADWIVDLLTKHVLGWR